MNLRELRAREDLDGVLSETLARHLSRLKRTDVRVSTAGPGQRWNEHRLFGALVSERPSSAVRQWLASLYRWTDRPTRIIPQAAAVSAASTALLSRVLAIPRLSIDPGLQHPNSQAILPGNQRVRLLDFNEGVIHVFQKNGFELQTLGQEVEARKTNGPFLPILDSNVPEGWLLEPLAPGYSLARCPPWIDRPRFAAEALERLEDWAAPASRTLDAGEYSTSRVRVLSECAPVLDQKFDSDFGARALSHAENIAAGLRGEVLVQPTHGDFQAGNVLVQKSSSPPILIDLEHSRVRSAHYDRLTWKLRSRNANGLAQRASAYLDAAEQASRAERKRRLAFFLLEDLEFFCRESLTGPYTKPSAGLRLILDELDELIQLQGRWWQSL